MAGGPIFPHSAFPVTADRVFPNFHVGAGANSKHDEGLGVEASVGADSTWRLRFQMPPTLPTGTAKLLLTCLANATSGHAVVNPKWASVKLVVEIDLNASLQWTASGSGTNEFYVEASGGGDPSLTRPVTVLDDDTDLIGGAILGAMGGGRWAWGDNDTLGFDTIYVQLSDGSDPDSSVMLGFQPGEEPSAASLNAEGTRQFEYYSDIADFYISMKIPLNADTIVASEEIVMDLVFVNLNWTLAAVSTWFASIIWE